MKWKKIIAVLLLLTAAVSSGCGGSRYKIINEKKSDMSIAVKDYGEGYIMNIEDGRFLIVGTKPIEEYNQLNAVWITVSKAEEIYDKLEVGKRVKFITDGSTLTSYPGIGGIRITDVMEGEYPESKSTEIDIIKKSLDAIRDISESKTYLCGVNNIKLDDGIWRVTMMKHEIVKDELIYYSIEINDTTKRIEKIIIGK